MENNLQQNNNYDTNILGNTTTQNTTETFVENAQPIQMNYGQINLQMLQMVLQSEGGFIVPFLN